MLSKLKLITQIEFMLLDGYLMVKLEWLLLMIGLLDQVKLQLIQKLLTITNSGL
jgi:hypothetical protein